MVGTEPSLGVRDQDTLSTIWFRHTSPGGGRRWHFKRSSVTCYSDSLADVPTKNENVVFVCGMPDLIYNSFRPTGTNLYLWSYVVFYGYQTPYHFVTSHYPGRGLKNRLQPVSAFVPAMLRK